MLKSVNEQPIPPPRTSSKQRSVEETVLINNSNNTGTKVFDRSQQQRHSTRSVGRADKNVTASNRQRDEKVTLHQRHSSGPTELFHDKDKTHDLIFQRKSLNNDKPNSDIGITKPLHSESVQRKISRELEQELVEILSKPIGDSNNLSMIKNELLEWFTKSQMTANRKLSTSKDNTDNKKETIDRIDTRTIYPKETHHHSAVPIYSKVKKRHSIGHNYARKEDDVPEWIQYPLSRLSAAGREKLGVGQTTSVDSGTNQKCEKYRNDINNSKQPNGNYKLRHSASENVHPSSSVKAHNNWQQQQQQQQPQPPPPPQESLPKRHSSSSRSKDKSKKRDRHKHLQTQRSATVSDMTIRRASSICSDANRRRSTSAEHKNRTATFTQCPECLYLPICTDPECTLGQFYDVPKSSSLPRCPDKRCRQPFFDSSNCNSLPRCVDSKCSCRYTQMIKCNSLPKCAEDNRHINSFMKSDEPHMLITKCDKLIKSASVATLSSRRRNKSVHFGENLLREVCQNRKLIEPLENIPSGSQPLQPNIQMLYNFVEGVLSSWIDEDDDVTKSGAESDTEHSLLPIYHCDRARYELISRVVEMAAQIRGTLKLGNSRYRHRHWRGTAKDCNERFLRKVTFLC